MPSSTARWFGVFAPEPGYDHPRVERVPVGRTDPKSKLKLRDGVPVEPHLGVRESEVVVDLGSAVGGLDRPDP